MADTSVESIITSAGGVSLRDWFRRLQVAALDSGGENTPSWLQESLIRSHNHVDKVPGLERFERQIGLSTHKEEVPFEIFVVGEGKAGKSTFINALFGREVALVDFLPKTYCFHRFLTSANEQERASLITEDLNDDPTWLHLRQALARSQQGHEERFWRYDCSPEFASSLLEGEELRMRPGNAYRTPILEVEWHLNAPEAVLPGVRLVDTQGLDQILASTVQKKHLEWEYGRADAVIWLVSAVKVRSGIVDRYLDLFGRFNKPAILVLNQIDRIPEASQQKVFEEARSVYGKYGLPVIRFCAKQAYEARASQDRDAYDKSGYTTLAKLLTERFESKQRLIRARSLYVSARQRQRDYRRAMGAIRDAAANCARLYREAVAQTNQIKSVAEQRVTTETEQQCRRIHDELRPRFATIGYEDEQVAVQDKLRVSAINVSISDFGTRLQRSLNQNFQEHLVQLRREKYQWPEVEANGEVKEVALLPRIDEIEWVISAQTLQVELSVSIPFFSRAAV
ncbi:dynamin family protein, partial [Armatimonas sp.]|uniref:dynamin family protein n=1 Tax=Armatimonas sp. TaxID=1872638 RepID=UPI003752CFEC